MKVLRYALLTILSLAWLAPLYLLIVNAARPVSAYDGTGLWTPSGEFGLFDNIAKAWDQADLGVSIGSTALYSVLSPAIGGVLGALVGFAITVLKLRHGFFWFMLIFGGTIFPTQMLLVPLFFGYADTDFYDSQFGMIMVYTAISIPLAAFVMRNFFSGVAYSLYEAAVVDGASTLRIFARIYLPLSRSALIAIFILQFTFIWNDLMFGLVLTRSSNIRPVMTALTSLQSAYAGSTVPVVLAGAVVLSVPTVLLFLLTQRFFTKGLTMAQL